MRTSIARRFSPSAPRALFRALAASLAFGSIAPPIAAAQGGARAAYGALVTTPVGAFAPAANASIGHGSAGTGLLFRIGTGDFGGGLTTFGVGFDRRLTRGRMSATVGFGDCDACDDVFVMAGADADWQIARSGSALGTNMVIHLRPSAGISNPADELAISLGAAAPVSIFVRTTPRLVLLLQPGVAFGHSSAADGSGLRALLGGGFAFFLPHHLSLHVGAQHVFVEGGETLFGATVGWHRP